MKIDIFLATLILAIIALVFFVLAGNTSKKIFQITFYSLGFVFITITLAMINTWIDIAPPNKSHYEHSETLPFEFNQSDREYYFYHQDTWIKAKDYIENFDAKLVRKSPYHDSCYVYKISHPVVLGFITNSFWNEDYLYRQSEDIVLQSREKKKIELHESK